MTLGVRDGSGTAAVPPRSGSAGELCLFLSLFPFCLKLDCFICPARGIRRLDLMK